MKHITITAFLILVGITGIRAQFQKLKVTPATTATPAVATPASSQSTGVVPPRKSLVIPAGMNGPLKKVINIGGGRSITVTLKNNVNTGTEPAFSKIKTADLPDQKDGISTCKVSKVVFTAESASFMNGNASNMIRLYPGAIYTFEDFMGGGYNEIISGRNPVRIYTDQPVNVGGTSVITVSNPSGSTVNDAASGIGLIRNSINQGGGGTDLKYRSYTSNSESELALKVTAGGSYGGFSASASFSVNNVSNKYYLTVDVVKPMFTIKAERPQSGFFSDPARATSNLVYVKEITYGTRILANIELKLEKREDILSFNAAYGTGNGGVSFNLGANFLNKRTESSKTVNAYVVGGPDSLTSFNVDQLEQDIRRLLANCRFQHARPVYYTLGDMNGSTVATQSATDEYTDRTCVPDNLVYSLANVSLSIRTGADNKEYPSQVALELYNRATSGILFHQPFENNRIEFPINNDKPFGLDPHPHANAADLTLESISKSGLALRIYYKPNLGTDAWKIEDVSITLEFKDQSGAPHPTLGRRTFSFNNANGFLNGWDHVLTCFTDGSLRPTTSSISQQ